MAQLLARSTAGLRFRARAAGLGQRGPIGVDLGHDELHLAQFASGAHGPILAATASLALPDAGAALLAGDTHHRRRLRQALRAGGFSGHSAIACSPRSITRLWLTNFRTADGESEDQAIARQVMERIDENPAEWSVDYVPIRGEGKPGETRTALIAMVRQAPQLRYLDALRAAGLSAEAMEIGPVAIRRLVASIPDERQADNALIVNFAEAGSFLTVVSGRRLLLDREFALGEEQLLEELAASLETDRAEATRLVLRYGVFPGQGPQPAPGADATGDPGVAETTADILKPAMLRLAEEIERVRFFTASQTHGSGIDRVYLLGSVSRWPGARELLASVLPYPVEALDPIRMFPLRPGLSAASGRAETRLAVAAGCALRGLGT